jgi:hypothetical protein
MLSRLVYASQATVPFDHDLPAILQWCSDFNPSLHVTGLLCFLDGVYMQYLEGEEAVLESLFASISKDTRHAGVTLLEKRATPQRAFPQWSMKLMEWDDRSRAIFRSFSPGSRLDLYASDPSTAAPLMRALIRGVDWRL